MKRILPLLFASFLFVSCNDQKEIDDVQKTKTEDVQNIETKESSSQELKAGEETPVSNEKEEIKIAGLSADSVELLQKKYDNYIQHVSDESKQFSPGELKDFLIPVIKGYETYPWNGGSTSYGESIHIKVETDYINKKERSSINFSITDCGTYQAIKNKEAYLSKPEIPGYEVSFIKNEYGSGFDLYSPGTKSGNLSFMMDKRFIIDIRYNNLSHFENRVQDVLMMFNFNALRKGVESKKK